MKLSAELPSFFRGRLAWLRIAVIAFTCLLICGVFVRTARDLATYPGIDLHCKVIPARLLVRGMDPYYDFRSQMHPDHLRTLGAATYSPALLLLYAPLCELHWDAQRIVYFLLDWISIFLCYIVLVRAFPRHIPRTPLWLAFVLLFIANFAFRLHLERGQYYIELALLAALVAPGLLLNRATWLRVLPLALLVLLRPTYGICIIGILCLRRFRYAAQAAALCLLLFAATLPVAGLQDWKAYFATVRADQQELLHAAYASAPPASVPASSQVLEGIDFSRSLTGPGVFADRTLIGVARGSVSPVLARLLDRIAPNAAALNRLNTAGLALALGFDLAVFLAFSRASAPSMLPVAFLFLAPLNLELFAPQRFAYCDLTILVPVLIILAAALAGAPRRWVLYCVILVVGFAGPAIAFRCNLHVPLVSFLQYVGLLAILNAVCLRHAWNLRRILPSGRGCPAAASAPREIPS